MKQAKEGMKIDYIVVAYVRDDSKKHNRYAVTIALSSNGPPSLERVKSRIRLCTRWSLDDIEGKSSWWFTYRTIVDLKKDTERLISLEY